MFAHLHVHTEYSLLDGMCRIKPLLARAKEMGMTSLAITDHGNMHGAIEFYQAAKEAGIKPIIGCETYVSRGNHLVRSGEKDHQHVLLLAKDQTGYQNLLQLVTRAYLEGFYYRPRVDHDLLAKYNKGLIALTACTGGEIPQLVLNGRLPEAREAADWYKHTFEDFYLEIQRHPIPELEAVNRGLLQLSAELDIPIVATNDVHYINKEDARAHDLLLCVGTNSSVNDEKRIRMAGEYFYLRSPEDMAALYQDIPQALINAERIAEMCNLKLEFGRLHLPEIELPPGKTPDEYLADLCYGSLERFYPGAGPEVKQRLDYELDVIKKTEFANYFLVVWDIVSFVRRSNILFGVRGSAAASIVLRCLGITEVDPLAHKLVFERFLNIERREMPDIDMDFQDDRRDEVISYVSQKYGPDHVAQIVTFGTLGARAAIRDIGRALGMPYGDVDRVARLLPNALNMTLDRALKENAELDNIYHADPTIKNLVDSAKEVEGISRHASTHAAGVVISKEALTKHVPLMRGGRVGDQDSIMTQYAMGDVARIGLLKMDFLGLANLTILGKAQEIIRQNRGIEVDLHRIPLDDARTFKLLADGETAGVFQLEGAGMRRYIKDLKPTIFSDIAAMVALYRPGPMEHIPTFIKAKHGEEPIRYPDPALASILEETYGVIVYQEQVLFIVQALAGYSLGQADIFRKAMGKKIAEVMKKERRNFMDGARKRGFPEEVASAVFSLIEPFAGYAFNKAHATSYALIAYQTAYLKANYPAEYITAFLTVNMGQAEKVASAAAECRRLGISLLLPDVNKSDVNFSIEANAEGASSIRFGLACIKNVGLGAVEPIVVERKQGGAFKSVEDLCRRCDLRSVNRRVMESLVRAGALDSLGNRGSLLQGVGGLLSLAQRQQELRQTGQTTMFDLWGSSVPVPMPGLSLSSEDVSTREKSAWEKELLGVPLSKQPFSRSVPGATLCGQVEAGMAGQSVEMVGEIAAVTQLYTRESKPFVKVILEDITGQQEITVWPRVYEGTKALWLEGNILRVRGSVRVRDDEVQVNCNGAERYEPPPVQASPPAEVATPGSASQPAKPGARKVVITVMQTDDEGADTDRVVKLFSTLKEFPGQDEVRLDIINEEGIQKAILPRAGYCTELQDKLLLLVGKGGGVHLENGQTRAASGALPAKVAPA